MQNISATWLYPLILVAGALRAWGPPMNRNILMSLIIDKYGLFGMNVHELSAGRIAGAILMVAGIAMISRF